jgi:hypothetical protein
VPDFDVFKTTVPQARNCAFNASQFLRPKNGLPRFTLHLQALRTGWLSSCRSEDNETECSVD